jgi:small subunit ribosomal protein S19
MQHRKKVFMYRGKELEELQKLDVREFAQYLQSRQRRTILRQTDEIKNFVKKAKENKTKNKPIKTHKRHLIIVPQLVGMKIQVYNGRNFLPVEISREMIGHVLGEFALTRSRIKHGSAGVGATKGSKALSKK